MDTETNPGAEGVAEVEDVRVDEVEANEPDTELDEDGNPVEQEQVDDSEEVEHDGVKHRIPKALKGAFLMQQDYTRKTQALAQERQAFEAARTSYGEATEAETKAKTDLAVIDANIRAFDNIDWDTWFETDPSEAQKAAFRLQQLERSRGETQQNLSRATQARESQAQQATVQRIATTLNEMAAQRPGFDQAKALEVAQSAQSNYGFSADEMREALGDTRMMRLLADLHEARAAVSKQTVQRKAETIQKVQPAAKVGGANPPAKLDDRTGIDAWMAKRNADAAKKAR